MKLVKNYYELPEKEGVYFLFSTQELLYIGRSINIRKRVKKHLHPSYHHEKYVNPKKVSSFGYICLSDHEDCKLTEQILIDTLESKNNGCENWFCADKASPESVRAQIEDVEL